LLYSLAIEKAGFTPNSMVVDEQQNFTGYGNVPATTTTCTGATIPMSEALALSRNCATAYIMKQLGDGAASAKKFIQFLKDCSMQTDIPEYPSICIGSAEISLYEMMQAYSMFPGRGFTVKPMYITRIEDKNGNTLQTNVPQRKEVISDVTAYSVINMMQGVIEFGTGRRMRSYGVDGEIAGKTGTTNDNSDAWFMGYTPQLLCGVWTGCDDRFIRFNSTELGQGSSLALPIWAYFYAKASADKNLAIDTKSTFVAPEMMNNNFNQDWINSVPENLGAEGHDIGNGSADQYGDTVPANLKPQDMTPESQLPQSQPNVPPTNNNNKSSVPPPAQQPKAVMPKKPGVHR
jgi:penicillin-binding protein 1A